MTQTFKHINQLTKKELIEIIKIDNNTINYLRKQLQKAGVKWS